MYAGIYAQLDQAIIRIKRLKQRCIRLETKLDSFQEMMELKKQVYQIKIELEKLKSLPTQIIIQKLENKVESIDVSKLEGILNIGVAQNHSGAIEGKDFSLGGKSLEEILSQSKQEEAPEEKEQQPPSGDEMQEQPKQPGEDYVNNESPAGNHHGGGLSQQEAKLDQNKPKE